MLDLISIDISRLDLDYLLAVSPILQTLTLSGIKRKRVHLRSQSLRWLLVGLSRVEDFAVVDAPLLESLILLEAHTAQGYGAKVKMVCAPSLRVLGYLDPRVHKLQIGDNMIRSDTVASRRSVVVPGLKILALTVNFRVLWEAKMLSSFLRCFPNIHTLHIESALRDPSAIRNVISREQHAELWQEVSAVKCLGSHLKKVVFHKFRGHRNEFEFLKFIEREARELESLLIVPLQESCASAIEVNEMTDKLGCPLFRAWASKVLPVSPKVVIASNLQKTPNFTINDPFCY